MSQQINLYDPALKRQRELLTLANVVAVSVLLLVVVAGWGVSERAQLAAVQAEAVTLGEQVKAAQEQVAVIGKRIGEAKPDPRLEADLSTLRALASLRGEIVDVLKKGVGPDAVSFAEYLRAFSRQTLSGLWLVGVSIGENGAMEIRGRMTDASLLPEYIRRLNAEKAFQGRAFAMLKVNGGKNEPAPGSAAQAQPAPFPKSDGGALNMPPPFLEFALIPVAGQGGARNPAPGGEVGKLTEPDKLAAAPVADSVPTAVGRQLVEAGKAALEGKR